jgi:hypothetical protein
MNNSDSLIVDFPSPCGVFKVTVEDNGKVAYAYLKRASEIVGDVWLYNRIRIPDAPEWGDRTKIPFANSRDYVGSGAILDVAPAADRINIDWEYEGNNPVAFVYVDGDLYGVVGVGDKPGYSRFAIKDSRLGRVMVIE